MRLHRAVSDRTLARAPDDADPAVTQVADASATAAKTPKARLNLTDESGAQMALRNAPVERLLRTQRPHRAPTADRTGESCPEYEPGERLASVRTGFLDPDVTETGTGQLIIADFGVDRRSVKDSARTDPTLQSWLRTFESDTDYGLSIVGHSDCVGTPQENIHLRQGRAIRVEALLGPSARSRVDFRGMAALGQYLSDNASREGRARNRAVVINFGREVTFPDESVPVQSCANPSVATTLDDYVHLVMCAEHALPSHTPRQMLSLLRQLYYSAQPWSRCTGAGCQFWSDVITCGMSVSDPRAALGTRLYAALRDSQVVADVDLGHVFTGLESMLCPSATVELNVPGPNWTVHMSNEDFATWGGDLGSAAAQKVHDDDEGRGHPWSHYFGTPGSLASEEDLTGDIDAFVIRHGIGGLACGSTAGRRMSMPSGPVSQMLFDFYEDERSALGAARVQGIACFAQAIGAQLSGSRITNGADLVDALTRRVYQFAEAFYRLKWHHGYFFTAGVGTPLLMASEQVSREFINWLELRI